MPETLEGWIFVFSMALAAFTLGKIVGDAKGWKRGRRFGRDEERAAASLADAMARVSGRARQQGEG